MSTKNKLNKLTKQLYPTGKAFNYSDNSTMFKLHDGLNDGFEDVVNDAKSLFDSIFPDSVGFTIEDVRLWEYNLGISSDENLPLQLRKDAILRKMTHPNNVKPRQHRLFIQDQLQKAGFGLFVHENTPPYKLPSDVAVKSLGVTQMGDNTPMGDTTRMGSSSYKVVANKIDVNESYIVGPQNIWATFFIGAEIKGNFASLPQVNERALRELILKLKPAHTAAYLFVDFYDTITADSSSIRANDGTITADSI